MQKKKNIKIGDLLELISNTPKKDLCPKINLILHHKTKRTIYLSDSSTFGNRCTICLEYEKYSKEKCMKCKKCNNYFHKQCYLYNFPNSNIKNENNFICDKCKKKDETSICILCGDDKGIMKNIDNNIYTHLYCLRYFFELKGQKFEAFRKWRFKSKCKVCKNVIDNIPVIKCKNTKCKNFYHIKCAIERNAIFSLIFQEFFFKIGKNDLIPFYCNFHSIYLVKEYQVYISKIDTAINKEKNKKIKYQKINNSLVIDKGFNNINNNENNINLNENKEKPFRKLNRNKLCIFLEKRKNENEEKILIIKEKNKILINNNINENEENKTEKDLLQTNENTLYNDNYFDYDSLIFTKMMKKKTFQELKEGLMGSNNNNLIYGMNEDSKFQCQNNEENIEKIKNNNEINSINNNKGNKEFKNDYNWHINLGINNISSPKSSSIEKIDIFELFNQINKDRSLPVYFNN